MGGEMTEQKFKEFLEILDNNILGYLELSQHWNSLELNCPLGVFLVIEKDFIYYSDEYKKTTKDDYNQWLSEVKAERGL